MASGTAKNATLIGSKALSDRLLKNAIVRKSNPQIAAEAAPIALIAVLIRPEWRIARTAAMGGKRTFWRSR
jgi:hypothetical protein